MPEYRVRTCSTRKAEEDMNHMAADGWRVIAVTANVAMGGVIITYERNR
ncbi:MAG: hypothetical protein J6Y48_02960 [Clostridia bacterium]|nr:hypothetical protein [Clostridia bacterium]